MIKNQKLWFGASYRFGAQPNANVNVENNLNQKHRQLTLLSGLKFGKFSLSYSYTQSFEDIQVTPFNSHQLTLGLDLFSDKFRYYPVRGML